MKRVCVFCGASSGMNGRYAEAARLVGQTLARRGIGLVYGGGGVGLMGVLADAALEAGGEVIGVIPRALKFRELAHERLTELQLVASMHERKARMAELSEGFIALPGGMGTLEELSEVLTWAQLGLHDRPCGLLDVEGYYQPLIAFFDRAVAEGFVRPEHRRILHVATDPDALLDRFLAYRPPDVARWVDPATS